MTIQIQPPFTTATLWVGRDQDFSEALPQILDGGSPMNLTDKHLELWMLPSFDNTRLFLKLGTLTGEITYDDATQGLASVFAPRATVRTKLPPTKSGGWVYFLLLAESVGLSTFYSEILRGPLMVFDGNVAAI